MLKYLIISMILLIMTESKQEDYKIDTKEKYATLSISEKRKKS